MKKIIITVLLIIVIILISSKSSIGNFISPEESLVNIKTYDYITKEQKTQGSGFFYKDKIITAYHVVQHGSIKVFYKGKEYNAAPTYADVKNDIAFLYVKDFNIPSVEIDTSKINSGDKIYTMSYPSNMYFVTDGIVSSNEIINIDNKSLMQMTCPVYFGSSGGMVLKNGKVIGVINSQIAGTQGFNFFTPINKILGLQLNKEEEQKKDTLYKDWNLVPDYSKEAVSSLKIKGIMIGDNNGNFNPNTPLTRKEAAIIIDRVIKKIESSVK